MALSIHGPAPEFGAERANAFVKLARERLRGGGKAAFAEIAGRLLTGEQRIGRVENLIDHCTDFPGVDECPEAFRIVVQLQQFCCFPGDKIVSRHVAKRRETLCNEVIFGLELRDLDASQENVKIGRFFHRIT